MEDGGQSSVASVLSWVEWQTETARVSATQIAHPASAVQEGVLSDYRLAGLVFPMNSIKVVAVSVGSIGSGTDLGIALHALLETVPLDSALDSMFDEKGRSADNWAGLIDLDRFVLLSKSVFESEPVRRVAREHRQEMHLIGVSPDASIVVEGIADLVCREDDGSLVIVDYKTMWESRPRRCRPADPVVGVFGSAHPGNGGACEPIGIGVCETWEARACVCAGPGQRCAIAQERTAVACEPTGHARTTNLERTVGPGPP